MLPDIVFNAYRSSNINVSAARLSGRCNNGDLLRIVGQVWGPCTVVDAAFLTLHMRWGAAHKPTDLLGSEWVVIPYHVTACMRVLMQPIHVSA